MEYSNLREFPSGSVTKITSSVIRTPDWLPKAEALSWSESSPPFMELGTSLPCSQDPYTEPHREPNWPLQSHLPTPFPQDKCCYYHFPVYAQFSQLNSSRYAFRLKLYMKISPLLLVIYFPPIYAHWFCYPNNISQELVKPINAYLFRTV
jgi:hypothetical protein